METASVFAQLSLKEGLTVFRDPEFSSDVGSSTVKRIADVLKLRIYQYPQDAGPMAHPVRPHSYIKMDNFYTVMVHEKKEEEFVFNDISGRPIPSLLRGFSAPVWLHTDLSDSDLFFLLAHDSDEFNHWEAGQILARKLMLSPVGDFQENKPLVLNPQFVQGLRSILCDSSLDKEFISKAITLPGEGEIMDMMEVADPDAVHAVRNFIRMELASALKEEFLNTVKNNHSSELYEFNHPRMARQAHKNIALAYLGSLEDPEVSELALNEYRLATNMTEQFAAFVAIEQKPGEIRDQVLPGFYNKGQHDFLAKKICDKYRVMWILNGMSM